MILYDLDGTLVDTRQDLVEAVNQMRLRLGEPALAPERILPRVGRGLRRLVADCLGTENPRRIEEGLLAFRPYYAEHLLDHSRLYPGALELLEHFRERRQAVLTNKPRDFSVRILEGLGVARFFSEVVGGDSDLPKKPDPAGLLALLSRQGVGPQEALFVGDSAIDVETGRNAGVETVIVLHGFSGGEETRASGPELTAGGLRELKEMAKSRGW